MNFKCHRASNRDSATGRIMLRPEPLGMALVLVRKILVDDIPGGTVCDEATMIEPNCSLSKPTHGIECVRDVKDGHAALAEECDLLQTFPLEGLVTHRQHFVGEKNVGINIDRNREA